MPAEEAIMAAVKSARMVPSLVFSLPWRMAKQSIFQQCFREHNRAVRRFQIEQRAADYSSSRRAHPGTDG